MERCVTLRGSSVPCVFFHQLRDNSSESKNFHGCRGFLPTARLAGTYSILLRINCSFDRIVALALRLLSAFSVNENFVPLLAALCRSRFPENNLSSINIADVLAFRGICKALRNLRAECVAALRVVKPSFTCVSFN